MDALSRLPLTPGILGFINLCYAIVCALVVLDTPPPPPIDSVVPLPNPTHDALCACILFAAGCVNIAIAWIRTYQGELAQGIADWVTTLSFVFAGLTNHATAYLFLRAKLADGVKHQECVGACIVRAGDTEGVGWPVEKSMRSSYGGGDC
ncbi:hypothetical protein H0H81_002914 [Sphagnurus paluster]|uniref:Uncharacterized protein n=1 Tax=Sphagnurus paluster TaxID=117069 RepID=A0A9P7GGL8_9AGAR|nr:hypothetical protein H0H81_002914 [Sphagnurus paluster]